MSTYPSDLEIASAANKISIDKVAATIDITDKDLIKFGDDKAKISSSLIEKLKKNEDGKLILVTAISPTPAGEGNYYKCRAGRRLMSHWKKSNDMFEGA